MLGSKPTSILLIGNNARDAASPLTPGQADLLFVVQVDPKQGRVVFISVPRDILVAYPGWRDPVPKVKSAFYMGGPSLAMHVVSRLTGLPIDGYVVADFAGFAAAINAVGGLTLSVRHPIYDPLHSGAVFRAGRQHMNGSEVLAFIRVRQNTLQDGYRQTDFGRLRAAYHVMSALKRQVLTHLSPSEVVTLLDIWRKDVATDLSGPELLALGMAALHAHFVHVTLGSVADSMVLPSTALSGANAENAIEGAYYDVVSATQIERMLAPFGARHPTTGLAPLPAPGAISVQTASAPLAKRLKAVGMKVTLRSALPPANPAEVLYPPGRLAAAEVVAQTLGAGDESLVPDPRAAVIQVLMPGP